MSYSPAPHSPARRVFNASIVAALALSVLWAALGTLHWPLVGDAPTIHYTTFLFDHGMAPYSQVVEMDQPGAYAVAWTARHVLGEGALAWRFADFLIIAVCWVAMIFIGSFVTTKQRWLPGFWAGALFVLVHFRDGPTHTGQRDLMMTAMLLPAVAWLLAAVKARRSWALLAAGIFLGAACTVKPSGVMFAAVLGALTLWHLHRRGRRGLVPALTVVDGFALPLLAMVLWLHHHHALRAYVATMRGLDAYHASLGRESLTRLVVGSFPNVMLAVALPAAVLWFAARPERTVPVQMLVAATLLGCASYIVQGKGFPYHRYPTEAFLFLLIAAIVFPLAEFSPVKVSPAELSTAVVSPAKIDNHWLTWLALATIAAGALFLGPVSAKIATRFDGRNTEFNDQLAADLSTLSGGDVQDLQHQGLQHNVQCFDNTAGCVDTLYNLRLVQATGYIYDCYAFQGTPSVYQDTYREAMMQALASARPRVLIFSDQECFTMNRRFTRVATWPQFSAWLAEHYTMKRQFTPPHLVGWWRKPAIPFSYRIYVQNAEGVR
jgi:hypothetical protein